MSEKFLYFASITSIVGLVLLSYAAQVLEPPLISIAEIDSRSLGKNVHMLGDVVEVVIFSGGSGGKILTVNDNTGSIDVYLDPKTAKHLNITEGHKVDIVGTVELYEDEIEIVPNSYKHVKIIGYSNPLPVKISDIDGTFLEKRVLIHGNISKVEKFKGGSMLLVVNDNTGGVNVYLTSGVAGQVNITKGKAVDITGIVLLYEGEIEIKVDDYRSIREG